MSIGRPLRVSCSCIRVRKFVPTPYPPDSAPTHGRHEFTSFAEMVHAGGSAVSAAWARGGEGFSSTEAETASPSTSAGTRSRREHRARTLSAFRRIVNSRRR